MQRLQSPPLNASPNGLRRGVYRSIDGTLQCGIPALDNDAGKATQNHFDETLVIHAASRPVDVGQTHADSFNRRCELAEFHPEFAGDAVSILTVDSGAKYTYVSRRRYLMSPSP